METKSSINNLSFQLQYNGNTDGIALKKTTENVIDRKFLPALEQLLDKYSPEESVLTIESITCDVKVEENDLNDVLTRKIMEQLEKQLVEKLSLAHQDQKPQSIELRFAETLLFYLQNGYMPWFATITTRQQLNEFIIRLSGSTVSADIPDAFFKLLKQDEVVNRICNDFDDITFWAFFRFLLANTNEAIISIWQKDYTVFITAKNLRVNTAVIAYLYKRALLKSIALYQSSQALQVLAEVNQQFVQFFLAEAELEHKLFTGPSPAVLQLDSKLSNQVLQEELVQKAASQIKATEADTLNQTKDKAEKDNDPKKKDAKSVSDPVYINNSGLVIIAPYLGMFFKKMDVTDDENKITKPVKAITLLNYIATGSKTFAEFEIVFPKLLCGLEPDFALTAPYTVTPKDIEIINDLLTSVIHNWPILKNTSIEGLRGTFLLREGKLTFKHNTHQLKVQRNAVDVLLEQLPWNINMIKLPWMEYLLTVDWI